MVIYCLDLHGILSNESLLTDEWYNEVLYTNALEEGAIVINLPIVLMLKNKIVVGYPP